MNYLNNIQTIKCLSEDEKIYSFSNWLIWIVWYYYGEKSKLNSLSEIYIDDSFSTFSWAITRYIFTSSETYSYYLRLKSETKKIPSKVLCSFVELSLEDRLSVLNKEKKVTWLGPSVLEQLKWKENISSVETIKNNIATSSKENKKEDEIVITSERYKEIKELLLWIDSLDEVSEYLNKNIKDLANKEDLEIIQEYLKKKV